MATAASTVPSSATPPASAAAAGRPPLKGTNAASSGPGNRRPTQSPVDGPQRRTSHKAWQNTGGPQQKYNNNNPPSNSSSPTPGQGMRSRTPGAGTAGESDTSDRHMHDRTTWAYAGCIGYTVTITTKSGTQYTGYLSGVDTRNNDFGVCLKLAKLAKSPLGEEDKGQVGQFVGGGAEKTMIFEGKDVVDVQAKGILLGGTDAPAAGHANGTSSTFKTDTDISGNQAIRERDLQPWQPDEGADSGLGLEDNTSRGNGQVWNQFEANERLFGVKSDFDENIYTTKLDRSHPEYSQREAAAAKIAAEIEGQSTAGLNAHIVEERGLNVVDDSGMDEEDKYSGVQRMPSGNPNKYTPPARRAPTGQPTVPGAPHDPAIIASQLMRPESIQNKPAAQQTPVPKAPAPPSGSSPQPAEPPKPREVSVPELRFRGLPVPSLVKASSGSPQIEKDLSTNFKNFVNIEKERLKKRKQDTVHRDREKKLHELKRFSESFKLKTEVPQDLVPILAKDKAKQAEIIEKAKKDVQVANANTSTSAASTPSATGSAVAPAQVKIGNKIVPADSFAAKDPERFQRETKALLQNFPRVDRPHQSIAQAVRNAQRNPNAPVRTPMPIPDAPRQFAPTGPAAAMHNGPASGANGPKKFNVNARPFDFKPNPAAAAFTPTTAGSSSAPAPVPVAPVAARAPSPSLFFGNKKIKAEKKSIRDHFNPFVRMKLAKANVPHGPRSGTPVGNSNDYIDKPWHTQPLWPVPEGVPERSYASMFVKVEYEPNAGHPPQPPHMMAPQPHHQQLPPHMPHIGPGHVPHQPHHGPMPQHLGIPPHYEQPGQMAAPSVMPSPSLHNATVAPYQQSPVPHQAQMAMYPGGQAAMGPYGAPNGPQFGAYYNGGYPRGAPGASPMVMHAPGPGPYPPGQMGAQFVHPQMYSPQQPQAYVNGPPPPGSQGFPSPGRPAPMMMHQGSSQGTPGGVPMVPYGIQPGQNGPMFGAQGQQSEFVPPGQNWPPQRSQSTVPFSSAVSSPRMHHQSLVVPPNAPAAVAPGTPTMLSPALAAFASPTMSTANSASSQPLQRSHTSNKALDVGDGGRSVGRGGRGGGRGGYHGGNGGGGRNGRGNMHAGGAVQANNRGGRGQDPYPSYPPDFYSNDPSINPVGMMRGQPPPPHHGGPPPHFYQQGPHGHYPPAGRGNGYAGPPQHPHGMVPPPQPIPPQGPQQQQGPPPPQPQQPQQQQPSQQPAAESTNEEAK